MADLRVRIGAKPPNTKPPKRFAEEFSFQRPQVEAKRKVTKPDETLHEIEIKLKLKFITLVMPRNSTSGGHALNLHYQFVQLSYMYQANIPSKTGTTHFTTVYLER